MDPVTVGSGPAPVGQQLSSELTPLAAGPLGQSVPAEVQTGIDHFALAGPPEAAAAAAAAEKRGVSEGAGDEDLHVTKRIKLDQGASDAVVEAGAVLPDGAAADAALTANDAAIPDSGGVPAQLLQHAAVLPFDPAAVAALGLSAEQQAQMHAQMQAQMQLMGLPLAPEALAALPLGPDGQPVAITVPLLGPGGELPSLAVDPSALLAANMSILGPDGTHLTPEQAHEFLATMLGSAGGMAAAGMPFVMPMAAAQGVALAGVSAAAPSSGGGEGSYKNWWEAHEEKELVQLAENPSYRYEKLGIEDLDWSKIAAYFGSRSHNAVRKKYWQLTRRGQSGDSDSEQLEIMAVDPYKRPRADRKLWTDEEALQLMRMVKDPVYRAQALQMDHATAEGEMWELLAVHFNCSVQTAKRKYRHSQEAMNNGTLGMEKGKRQHHRKQTPYRWMIVRALGELPNYQGTAPEIFTRIEATPEYTDQLDLRIMPGTKNVPRWKIQVRKVLSADKIFQHTGLKQKHETVWRLDQRELHEVQASSRSAGRNTNAAQAAAQVMQTLGPLHPYDAGQAAGAVGVAGHAMGVVGGDGLVAGAPHLPADVADFSMVHQQIAAAIASAPLVIPADQLPQVDMTALHQLAMPPQVAEAAGAQADPAAAAAAAIGELAGAQHAQQVQQQQQQVQPDAAAVPEVHGHVALHPHQIEQIHAAAAAAVMAAEQAQQHTPPRPAGHGRGEVGGHQAVHDPHAVMHPDQLAQLAMEPMTPIDPATLAALAAANGLPPAGLPADGGGSLAAVLPLVQQSIEVEVPAPLSEGTHQ